MKKATAIQIVLIIVLSFTACQKEDHIIQGLDGTWIEIDTQTDTIIFNTNSLPGLFLLNRGYEIRNGAYLPRLGSGPYFYKISHDSINVHWTASSLGIGQNYFFKFNESAKTFNIDVFTAFATNKARLTFRKLE